MLPSPDPRRVSRLCPHPHLKHGVRQEGLQRPLLAIGLGLVVLQQLVKIPVLLAVGQNLQAVLVVPDKLLVDVQHRQQNVKEVSCKPRGTGEEWLLLVPGRTELGTGLPSKVRGTERQFWSPRGPLPTKQHGQAGTAVNGQLGSKPGS